MIPLIYTWARSGATVLNKCLAAMGHTVLSELHSEINSGIHAPRWQAIHWHDINIPTGTPWDMCIFQLSDMLTKQSRSLIVRDWTINSFYAHEFNDDKPIGQLRSHVVLGERCKPVAFIRNAIDCALSFAVFHRWASSRQLSSFSAAYLRYVQQLKAAKIPLFHYEDFCKNPEAFLVNFCDVLGVEFSKEWETFNHVTKLLGDTYDGSKRGSRAIASTRIAQLSRRRVRSIFQQRIVSRRELHQANKLLGYTHN